MNIAIAEINLILNRERQKMWSSARERAAIQSSADALLDAFLDRELIGDRPDSTCVDCGQPVNDDDVLISDGDKVCP